jgi:sortase A
MGNKIILKISALVSAISGIVIITSTIYPIASYEAFSKEKYPTLLSPVAEKEKPRLENYDYTKASNWFVGSEKNDFVATKVSFYTISIPKLKIENATVAIGGEDLSKSLIQYPGTALPGKNGNAVIFGHSILPRFYDPENYMAIFSTLPTLEKGDELEVDYDGINFLYRVIDIFEVLPTDIQVLDQDMGDSYLTLVTCTPPGDPRKPKRLIVRARVIPPDITYANIRN